jgi:hypothetical protein
LNSHLKRWKTNKQSIEPVKKNIDCELIKLPLKQKLILFISPLKSYIENLKTLYLHDYKLSFFGRFKTILKEQSVEKSLSVISSNSLNITVCNILFIS